MNKAFYLILSIFFVPGFTCAMEREKQNNQTHNNHVLGVPTLFDRLPRELRREIGIILAQNNPELARQCWNEATAIKLDGNAGCPLEQIVDLPGDRLVTIGDSGSARLWQIHDGHPIALVEKPKIYDATRTTIMNAQGTRIANLDAQNKTKLWNAVDGSCITTLAESSPVCCQVFSAQGDKIATGSEDAAAKVWNAQDGSLLLILKGHTGAVRSLSFDSGGANLLTVSDDKTARIWDAKDGFCRAVLGDPTHNVRKAKFNAQGTLVVTSNSRQVKLWDAKTGQCITTINLETFLFLLEFSPRGDQVITEQTSGSKQIWNMDGTCMDLETAGTCSHNLRYSPNGDMVAIPYPDRTVQIVKTIDRSVVTVLIGHSGPVTKIRWNMQQDKIATCTRRSIRIWNVQTGQCICTVRYNDHLDANSQQINSIEFNSKDDKIIVRFTKMMGIWDTHGNCFALYRFPNSLQLAQFNPTTTMLFAFTLKEGQSIGQILRMGELPFAKCVQLLKK